MLLYLMKHSCPDISNTVRELSKVVDGATEAHMKMLLHCIKYILDIQEKGLLIRPTEVLDDYSGDCDKHLSVTGFIIYLLGVAIVWACRAQCSIPLLSTEAEYITLSEVCRKILFIAQIMEFLGMMVK